MSDLALYPYRLERAGLSPTERYFRFLCICLLGYACLGKGFAYIGYPPLFIGEVVLALGLVAAFASGSGFAVFASIPSVLLTLMLGVACASVFANFGEYGIDSLRDSVVVGYGLFAFVVVALLLERPERLGATIDRYSRFAYFYGCTSLVLSNLIYFLGNALPTWPGLGGIPIIYLRLGEVASHTSAAAVFALLGLRRVSPLWTFLLLIDLVGLVPSRGGLLAGTIPIAVAAVIGGKLTRFLPVASLLAFLLVFAAVIGIEVPTPGGRSIGPSQIVEDAMSIVGFSDEGNLNGTKEWRLHWWETIRDYTLYGPYFWTGKGFGINLAVSDGFVVSDGSGAPPLRSPHNSHLSILARLGVPAFCLWVTLFGSWFLMMMRSMLMAKSDGNPRFASVFLWIACYALGILVDASFDVALEGPMLGIWLWCVIGFGIGASMIYRSARVRRIPGMPPLDRMLPPPRGFPAPLR